MGSLCVIALMTLFLVSQYAGSPKLVELIPTGTPDDQQRAHTYLLSVGFPAQLDESNRLVVASDQQYPALAQLTRAQMLPNDKTLMFSNLIEQQNMFMPRSQLDQMYTTAATNELAKVIQEMEGIESASVFVANPQPSGIGQAARKSTATVTVFPERGQKLDQKTVDSLADVVSGAFAGLDRRNVAVVDGIARRSYRASAPEDAGAQSYMEQVAAVEDRVRQKIEDHLGAFIQGVVVSVNAMVDGSKRETREEKAFDKGEGTVSVGTRESNTTSTSRSASEGGQPGIGSNIELGIGGGSSAGGNTTETETTETESAVKFGTRTTHQVDPRGRPTKINVAVSVPRDWVVQVLKSRAAAADTPGGGDDDKDAAPTEDEITREWQAQQSILIGMIKPLVDTKDVPGTLAEAGDVVVSLMPVALGAIGTGGGGAATMLGGSPGTMISGRAGGGGGGGGIGSLLSGGLIKQVALGLLALVSLGMMFVIVRKSAKTPELPSAEELVGIPPALQADSDLVGEADESDTAMLGIEVDSDVLKTSKMLDEVHELVKNNPSGAATVFSRWLSTED